MNKQSKVEDNIFAVNLRIKMLKDTALLDTDTGLFLDKILDDLEFIDQTLEALLKALEENSRLIRREGYYEDFSETEWQLNQLLSAFLNGSSSIFMDDNPLTRERISMLRMKSDARRKTIELSGVSEKKFSPEPLVSGAELSELLRDLE
ncbi:hypothetical protein AGMMS49928_22210 [Spirochaetia bacterium]|nr:hypothetical protein AGMMS49928_22210 [Spirochaetia bacterium]